MEWWKGREGDWTGEVEGEDWEGRKLGKVVEKVVGLGRERERDGAKPRG